MVCACCILSNPRHQYRLTAPRGTGRSRPDKTLRVAAETDQCPDGSGICRGRRPAVARDYATNEDDPPGLYRHLRGRQQCHGAPQFVSDQGEIPKVFLFRDASNGLDAFRHVHHRNVLGHVRAVSGQINGADANRLPGQKQTRGMFGGSGHVPPNFAPTPSTLTRAVYQQEVRHAKPQYLFRSGFPPRIKYGVTFFRGNDGSGFGLLVTTGKPDLLQKSGPATRSRPDQAGRFWGPAGPCLPQCVR